jgi:hypothetical protein
VGAGLGEELLFVVEWQVLDGPTALSSWVGAGLGEELLFVVE